MRLIFLNMAISIIIMASYGMAADYNRNHFGANLDYGENLGSFVGLFAEAPFTDDLTAANLDFLAGTLSEDDVKRGPQDFEPIRRLKVVAFDSVFISSYGPAWKYGHGDSYFVLNDLKNDIRLYLNELTTDEFNQLLRLQGVVEPFDLVYLGQLYIVLMNFSLTINFVEDASTFSLAYKADWGCIGNDLSNKLQRLAEGRVVAPKVDSLANGEATVGLCNYDALSMQVLNTNVHFQGLTIKGSQNRILIPREELLRQIGE